MWGPLRVPHDGHGRPALPGLLRLEPQQQGGERGQSPGQESRDPASGPSSASHLLSDRCPPRARGSLSTQSCGVCLDPGARRVPGAGGSPGILTDSNSGKDVLSV